MAKYNEVKHVSQILGIFQHLVQSHLKMNAENGWVLDWNIQYININNCWKKFIDYMEITKLKLNTYMLTWLNQFLV